MLKNKRLLMVLAPKNFKDEEYYVLREILDSMNIRLITTSIAKEAISTLGRKEPIDILFNEATSQYDGIILIGGPGMVIFFENERLFDLIKEFYNKNKIVAALCIAPTILANSKILQGKKATAFPSEEQNLKNKNVIYTGDLVTVDGKIITGKSPASIREFATQIIKELSK
ncbi:MAG: DJ-1/PfpI family protein [Candidatus Nanoarchaeia archaeon]|nr:DJ-1/PfpI family protein [Candidatus Nanoarchaeia archaeon]